LLEGRSGRVDKDILSVQLIFGKSDSLLDNSELDLICVVIERGVKVPQKLFAQENVVLRS